MPSSYILCSDSQLIDFLRGANDESAFAEIYRRYGRELVREAIRKTENRSVAEDLVQEVFVQFWLKRSRLFIEKNIQAYLKGMLKYHVIDYFSDSKRCPIVPSAALSILPEPHENDYLSSSFLQTHYQEALLKLPQKCREVFELSRKGYSAKDIAHTLAISEKTVEVHIGKALRFLRLEMKDYLAILAIISYLIKKS